MIDCLLDYVENVVILLVLFFYFRQIPPGTISGPQLGEAAHRLLVNSLQLKGDSNGYNHSINGPQHPYAAPMGHPPPLLPTPLYEPRPGYPPQVPTYASVPTQHYGYNQPYSQPTTYNHHHHHHQSNSYGRNNHEHPRSHHYGRNHSSAAYGSGGSARHGYQSSENDHNARFVNTQGNSPAFTGAYANHYHGQHGQNYHSSRASSHQQGHQNWVPRNNSGGSREHGHSQQWGGNQYSLLDSRANRRPQPPSSHGRR